MLQHIPFKSLYTADHGWLKSHFHFSFAEYHNPENIHFGVLRVMNDDIVQAHTGFGIHPHKDMEIVSYVISGELSHSDSIGNKESLKRGDIQYLSAGTGITHSEMNDTDDEVHFIQTWIVPQAKSLTPNYGSKQFSFEDRHNKWLHLVGPKYSEACICIYQDASMYVTEVDDARELEFNLREGRQLYLKLMEGQATVNGKLFEAGDAAEIQDEKLIVKGIKEAHILLVEMSQ